MSPPPGSVYWRLLPSRLRKAWERRSGSPLRVSGAAARSCSVKLQPGRLRSAGGRRPGPPPVTSRRSVSRHSIAQGAQVGDRQLVQVTDQTPQAQDVGVQGVHRRPVQGPHPVLQGLQLRPQQGDGGAQFMGDVRHPAAAGLLVALQGRGQGVEVASQAGDLIAAVHGHAGGEVPGGQPAGRLLDAPHRPHQPP